MGKSVDYPSLDSETKRFMGEVLTRKRKEKGWSGQELADRIKSDPSTVSRHENGRGFSIEYLSQYAGVFCCSMDDFFPRAMPNSNDIDNEIIQRLSQLSIESKQALLTLMRQISPAVN